MARLLLIVSRTDPARFAYLKHVFGGKTVDVIFDRRAGERQSQERAAAERRRMDRRERDITTDLQIFGWALVRR